MDASHNKPNNDWKAIPLTNGLEAIVDADMYEELSQFNWCRTYGKGKPYVRRWVYSENRQRDVFMHRFIMNAPAGKQVDHINGNTLDNRRANLRLCTGAENSRNSSRPKNAAGARGVQRAGKKYVARICMERKLRYLGTYETIEEAVNAYNAAAIELHGEFALLSTAA